MDSIRSAGGPATVGEQAHLVTADALPGVRVVPLVAHEDARGRFVETYREAWFEGVPPMLQSNRSDSRAGVLRGLHFHKRQADYWYVVTGRMLAALADLRVGSPTRGKVALVELDGQQAVYIPPGVAHGYYAPVDATMTYLVDQYYDNTDEFGVAWDDPDLSIPWPFGDRPILSARDEQNPRVADLRDEDLVRYLP